MIVYFPSLIADCLILNSIQYRSKVTFWSQIWMDSLCQASHHGSLAPSKKALPLAREANIAHSGIPGPPNQAQILPNIIEE